VGTEGLGDGSPQRVQGAESDKGSQAKPTEAGYTYIMLRLRMSQVRTPPLFFTLYDPIVIKTNISKEKVYVFYA